MKHLWHLVKRFATSIGARPLGPDERLRVGAILTPAEAALFDRFNAADQRHALVVLARFDAVAPGAPLAVRRAALLHDIGKVDSSLGTLARVVATIVGGRTAAFRAYHAHEAHGAELLRKAGSDAVTVALVAGVGEEPWRGWLAVSDAV